MFQYCYSNKTTKPRNLLDYRAFVLHNCTQSRTTKHTFKHCIKISKVSYIVHIKQF